MKDKSKQPTVEPEEDNLPKRRYEEPDMSDDEMAALDEAQAQIRAEVKAQKASKGHTPAV